MRTIDSAAATAAKQPSGYALVAAAELDFGSGFVRLNSSPYAIVIDGQTYQGIGRLGSIEGVEEGAELQAYSIAFKLSGVPADMISIALAEHYQGRSSTAWLAILDANHALAAPATKMWKGRMDVMDVRLGQTAEIALSSESPMADWERPRIRRYTDADQQAEIPGDLGAEFVWKMQAIELVWGRA